MSTSGGSTGTSDVDPSQAVAGASATGSGACKGRQLGELMKLVYAKHPELSDISTVYDPNSELVGDGSFVYAFPTPDGFRLVFTRGSGDCESGCIDKAYWYFETNAACEPILIGEYSRVYSSAGNCFQTKGQPLWGFPGAPPPGCDSTPQDVSGVYDVTGKGGDMACSTEPAGFVDVTWAIVLDVSQDLNDPSRATVIIHGTGNDLIDGVSFPASVNDTRLSVAETTMLPASGSNCGANTFLTLQYDVATHSGSIRNEEVRYLDCATMTYCKGMFQVELKAQ